MHHSLESLADIVRRDCVGASVRQIARKVTVAFDHRLSEHGLTLSQFNLLSAIVLMKGAASTARLSKQLEADRSTVSREVGLLVNRGVIEIGSVSGRSQALQLTELGESTYLAAFEAWKIAGHDIDQIFGADRAQELLRLTQSLLDPSLVK